MILDRLVRRSIFKGSDEFGQLRQFLGETPGVFVEVGANDPIKGSQTYQFELAGWNGVLVEPLSEYASSLRASRRAAVFEVAAGPPEDDGKDLPLLVAGGLSTLMPSIVQPNVEPTEVRLVKVRTLDHILKEAGVSRVNFLSIDVEGAQHSVVRGLSLEEIRPDLILVEDDVHDLDTHKHLMRHGYKLVRRTALNNWYVPIETPFMVSLFGRLQIVRKLHLGRWLRRWKRKHLARRRKVAGSNTP